MQTLLKVDFHGTESNEALQSKIAEHVGALEHLYGRLTACHVSVEAPGHHHRKGGLFHVSIRLTLPDEREVNVGSTPRADHRHADILFAINDAFRRARRQLQDRAREMRGQVKAHEAPPIGTIARFDPNTGYGFIEAADGHEVYFHQNSFVDFRPSQIQHGLRVSFVEEMGEKGPQASTVRSLDKHAMR
jgi:cold shock CspA family protein/ribosome-associated translation inhibitor RaiA